ncbi:MAG TPA: inositol-3-phosphate synthase [Polyangiaceae bacterium]|nr:inositol-3-phosphate synthase [Polyangiaceae bacterium]
MKRIGVAIVGVNGAVASTVIAGVELMKRGLAPRVGMVTERTDARIAESITELLDFAPLENLVFAGWDLQLSNVYEGTLHHKVLPAHVVEQVRPELERIKPWPAVFAKSYVGKLSGENVVTCNGMREEIAIIERDLEGFRKAHALDRVVMVNLASTERFLDVQPVHRDLRAFEAGLDANDPAITPAMRYFYAANRLRIPYCNFTPSLTNVPALAEQANETGNPFAGMDGKTGQTLLKTALASMLRARRLFIEGWYSTNVLGNSDGLVLDDPSSNKTKVLSKSAVLDSIVGYHVENHQVHIHYYKPRGDSKEAWDNIDIVGFAGVPMQIKVNFLCQDSVLAAPLVIDLVRLLDVAKSAGERGIQRQLSMFFKSPYHAPGEAPVHDLFKQEKLLLDWARSHANASAKPQPYTNGVKAHAERTP